MARAKSASSASAQSSANLGFEAKMWQSADKLRNNMDAAEYKHIVLGLIFLKYISDTFDEHHAKLKAGKGDYDGANPEDKDEYLAANVFWVPKDARWPQLQSRAKLPSIGQDVDDAMVALERDNPRLKGALNKNYGRADLDKHRLGELIDLIGSIELLSRPPSPQPSPSVRGSGDSHYRGGYDFSGLVEKAHEFRKKQTPAEELLWQLLRDRQLCDAKFRRQHQFGDYLCDFYCHDAKLVVECDGEPHHTEKGKKHDAKRDAYLKSQALTVLRFQNDRVLNDTSAVLEKIASYLPSTNSSPSGRGRGEGAQLRRGGGEGGQEIGAQATKAADAYAPHRSFDLLGRVFEYFLTQFASAEGKNGGQFYTPSCVVRLLVTMLAPYKGRIYDPACGSGGMFVQSEKFVESHGGKLGDISIYGQESNPTTRRLAVMNLALRGIEADFGPEAADTFRRDLHPDLRADYVLANPPFNDSDWFRKDDDVRWQYGVPPKGNANFAWVQHFIHHLAPHGMAGFVLANGSMSSNQSGEGEIRQKLIEADLVDCMVALPGQLFYSTQIPVCLWFICRDKSGGKPSPGAGRRPLPAGEGKYRGGYDFSGLVQIARELRAKSTPAGKLFWELVRDRRFLDLKFRREHQIGDYIADFYCDEKKLVVELDGDVHETAERKPKDAKRDAYLRSLGLIVVRIRNESLLNDTEAVFAEIASALNPPRPAGEGRGEGKQRRDRRGQTLFIDARKLGTLIDRVHRELTDVDLQKIVGTYHAWRGDLPSHTGRRAGDEGVPQKYADVAGFCKSATTAEIAAHGFVLTPGRYVGAEEVEGDGEPFEEKMPRLVAVLNAQFAESARLEKSIQANLRGLGYGE